MRPGSTQDFRISSTGICPKCGGAWPPVVKYVTWAECHRHETREHMHVSCSRCGYTVEAPCLDTPAPVEVASA